MPSSAAGQRTSFLAAIVRRWRNWIGNRSGRAELERYSPEELQRTAQEVGINPQELRVLAGKWPTSADLLSRRMAAIGFDAAETANSQPNVSNDLKRLCSLCVSKGRCQRDLADNPDDPIWREYCPNASTLAALDSQRLTQPSKDREK